MTNRGKLLCSFFRSYAYRACYIYNAKSSHPTFYGRVDVCCMCIDIQQFFFQKAAACPSRFSAAVPMSCEPSSLPLCRLFNVCESRTETRVKAKRPIHFLVTRSTAYGKARYAVFTAPCLRRLRQFSRNSFASKNRFDVKIFVYACVRARECGVALGNAAHTDGFVALLCNKENNLAIFYGMLKQFLLFLGQWLLAYALFEVIFQLQKLSVGGTSQNLHGNGDFVVFRERLTDGDLVFHFVSSKNIFGGLGSVNPPYTTHFHKISPFLFCISFILYHIGIRFSMGMRTFHTPAPRA